MLIVYMAFTDEDLRSHHHSDDRGHHSSEDSRDHSESRHSTGHTHTEGSRPHEIVIDIPPGILLGHARA